MAELSILIIEDDEVAAEILQKFIHHVRPEAEVAWVWNGFEALVRIKEASPDLIFLDYMMPKIDGMVFMRDVNSLAADQHFAVAVVSAFVDDKKRQEFLDVGVDYVVNKPISIEKITEIIDATLKKKA
jgi:two-component system, OmpR family, response regulator BaeR